jgi:CheY-like chemotaxis protein
MVRIDFNGLRFLVIDDNAHMRRILRTLLDGFGARDAAMLTKRLREVTDEFLLHENQGRPEMLVTIMRPPLAPEQPI